MAGETSSNYDGFARIEDWMRWKLDEAGNQAKQIVPTGRKPNTVGFDMSWFRAAIIEHGDKIKWEQAARCPCAANEDTGQPDPTCDVCAGKAWEYHSPQPIRGIVDRLEYRLDALERLGDWAFGGCMVTVDPLHRPNFRDRFTLLESVKPHSELVARGIEGRADRLTYPIRTVQDAVMVEEAGERVRRQVKTGVIRLRLMDEARRTPGPVLREGVDFEISPEGRVDWTLGDGRGSSPRPRDGNRRGGRYAVTYLHAPAYLVGNYPFPFRLIHTHFKTTDWNTLQGPVSAFCSMEVRQGPEAPIPDG